MAVYINEGHSPDDGGKPFKHIAGSCPSLLERSSEGYTSKRIRNVDAGKSSEQAVRRRCPVCFVDLKPIQRGSLPFFLRMADRLQRDSPGAFWVYDLRDQRGHDAQVGMATDMVARLRSRWRATLAGGYRPDVVPWLNLRLAEDPAFEPTFAATSFKTRADALAGERALRDELRADAWNVSSDV